MPASGREGPTGSPLGRFAASFVTLQHPLFAQPGDLSSVDAEIVEDFLIVLADGRRGPDDSPWCFAELVRRSGYGNELVQVRVVKVDVKLALMEYVVREDLVQRPNRR